MKKFFSLILLVFLFYLKNEAQNTFRSVQNGNWDDASTWFSGAAAGGIEGINYPSPSDSVFIEHDVDIVTATSGTDFVFTGYLNVADDDTLRCTVGTATTGFTLDGDAVMHVYGIFYTAVIGDQPATATPTAKELISEGNSQFIAFSGSFLFVADDWAIQENADVYIEEDVCLRVDDDINFDGTGWTMCGDGDISIGGEGPASTVNFSGGATDAQVCTGTSIVRNTGGIGCTGGGVTTITTGTGPAGSPPIAYDDFITTEINQAVEIDVLDLDTADFDIALDTLQILQLGSNGAINDNLSVNGGILSINNNGTPSNFKDDFVDYTPAAGFEGEDTFEYIIEDEEGLFDTATVTVNVINCGNSYVDLIGVGANGSTTATLTFTDTTSIDSIRLDLIYKNGKPSFATFVSSAGETNSGNQFDAINIAGDDDGVYRTTISSASSVTVTHDNSGGVRSFLAYIYRRGKIASITSVADDQVVYLFQDSYSFTQDIPAGAGPRNIRIQMPISELNEDSRSALLEVQAGPVFGSLETFSQDLGNSLKIFTLVLEDVPGNVTELDVTVTSKTGGAGDSFVTAGIDFGIQCSGTAPEAVPDFASTPENTAVTIDILANDIVGNGGFDTTGLTNIGLLDPQNGTVSFNSLGQAIYTPDPGFTGVDYFQYEICDTLQLCDITNVTVTVTCATGNFTEVGETIGLDLDGNKDGGLSWADLNKDGLIDVIVNTNNGTNDTRIFFAQKVGGILSFNDVTTTNASGLLDNTNERSVVTGDLNNDGYIDFVRNTYQNTGIEIWFNNGPGSTPAYSFGNGSQDENISINTFSTSNNSGDGFNTEGVSLADWNQDGWLDIIVENDGDGVEILENDRDGTFSEVAHATSGFPVGTGGSGKGDYATVIDYDNDGFVDYMARRADAEDLFRFNPVTSEFEAVATPNLLTSNGEKGAITFCDVDNDADFDIIWAHESDNNNTSIYLQNADGTFSFGINLTNDAGVEECDCADVDNDGDNDIFLGDDDGTSYLFKNNTPKGGALSFTQDNECIDPDNDVEGSEFVDYDMDGDMDLYMNVNGGNEMWQNGQDDNNFLIVEPRIDLGSGRYQSAIGANVVLVENCTDTCQIRDVSGGRGHGSQKPEVVHFGLPNGPTKSYKVITYFVDKNGTRTVVTKSVTPSSLSAQKLIVYNTDSDLDLCVDADDDGRNNNIDIDDDNDGILDVDEGFGLNNPVGDEDGDGILNFLDVSDGGAGDGSVTNYTDADGNGIPDVFDTDGDGVPNHFDLDSDNDGVPDIIEAGGVDTDSDGRVDVFADPDNDGWASTFDNSPGQGGIPLTDADTDSDGLEDRIDLDSDNDGVQDIIEAGGEDFDKDGQIQGIDTDGDGLIDSIDSDNGGEALADGDTDNDGQKNRVDLDSDNDGVGDITEAGGADTDFNGVVDGVFADTDNDGWSNVFDSDNDGTALNDTDTDSDELPNRIDIDSDNDGIIDIIEAQPSGTLIIPSGTDSDNDGIDDNFDPDSGNTLTNPENTDGTDNPDYTDTDSDNDGEADNIEGWDTDNDGIANTISNNLDADNDGLIDSYNDLTKTLANASTLNVTNNGQDSDDFPNLDRSGTPERDWREDMDNDNDGIVDDIDIDDDNDGILDTDEGCVTGSTYVSSFISAANVSGAGAAINAPNGTFALFIADNSRLTFDYGTIANLGTPIFVTWKEETGQAGTATFRLEYSIDNSTFFNDSRMLETNSLATVNDTVASQFQFRYLRIRQIGATRVRLDAIGRKPQTICPDMDMDGTPDNFDLDSDNDGIADIIESGGIDSDGNGIVDGMFIDADNDGFSNVFDTDEVGGVPIADEDFDADGKKNRVDIDADNDGIIDVIEGQVSTVTPILPSGIDSDGDGIDDVFDPDSGNSLLAPINTDGTDTPDYIDLDSDNDRQVDISEAYDTDGDGEINIIPTGVDSDGDGLDDAYDVVNPINDSTNVSNNKQTSSTFPDDDNPSTSERDWREASDVDNDGVLDVNDIDNDNDGIPDLEENCTVVNSFASNFTAAANVSSAGAASGAPNGSYATFTTSNSRLDYDFGTVQNIGTSIILTWREQTGQTGTGTVRLEYSLDNVTYFIGSGRFVTDNTTGVTDTLINEFTFRYLRIRNTTDADVQVDAIEVRSSPSCEDFDNDGIPDYLDLDADNDGITDIIEAGGVDTNGDGLVDDIAGTVLDNDTDNNGLDDFYDAGNGGTAISDPDTDGDGLKDKVDIDADNDGIVDLIEAQVSTATPIVPSGTDSDGDGIDNNFDTDSGNSPLVPIDTDADGDADYIDTNSDNDGLSDLIEAYDTDNDDLIDVTPGVVDADGDGLLDGFPDNITPINSTTNPTNGGQNSNIFPNDQVSETTQLDWRERPDTDNDGIADADDLDDDNDGIPDSQEGNCGATTTLTFANTTTATTIDGDLTNGTNTFTGFTTSDGTAYNVIIESSPAPNTSNPGDGNSGDATIDGYTGINNTGDRFVISFINNATGLPIGLSGFDFMISDFEFNGGFEEVIPEFSYRVASGDQRTFGDGDWTGWEGENGIKFGEVGSQLSATADGDLRTSYAGGGGTQADKFARLQVTGEYITGITISQHNTSGGVTFGWLSSSLKTICDSDNDGIANYLDLDSDNDGIPDIVEAGGEDTDGNGKVDNINANGTLTADTDNNGLDDLYDSGNGGNAIPNGDQDGDGIVNALDLDADNDGIPDVTEALGTDANGDGRADNYVDTDNDGFNDVVDGDVGNDGTSENTANALVVTAADGNNDGIPDSYPNKDFDNDGVPNYLDLDADDDGILDVYEAEGSDTDQNGQEDNFVDADNDGFNDAVDGDTDNSLAVGNDSNDDNFANISLGTGTDGNNDGAPDTFPNKNFDGDNNYNFLDIDSDNDGITDNTEGQGTFIYVVPSNADDDGDGIDNAYDADDANFGGDNSGFLPSDIDGFDDANSPDFLDLDSDGDGELDALEGHDSNGDGTADAGPANTGFTGGATDVDGDGLLDGFDNNTASKDPTNTNLQGTSHPDADMNLSERDWREFNCIDSDADGICDINDIDDDNDGILDSDENVCSNSETLTFANTTTASTIDGDLTLGVNTFTGFETAEGTAFDVIITTSVENQSNNVGDGNSNESTIDGYTGISISGERYNIRFVNTVSGNPIALRGFDFRISDLESDQTFLEKVNKFSYKTINGTIVNYGSGVWDDWTGANNIPFGSPGAQVETNASGQLITTYTGAGGNQNGKYARLNVPNVFISEITVSQHNSNGGSFFGWASSSLSGLCDKDDDGLINQLDVDSDGDGIADIIEAGGVDGDNNGVVDGVFADDDEDGLSDVFDTDDGVPSGAALADGDKDGDGIENRCDLDSDNDGLADVIEAGGTDADGDGLEDGATLLQPVDTDGDGNENYLDLDSDSDGITDNVEGQTTVAFVTPLGSDTDNDGWDDRYDGDVTGGVNGIPITLSNNDGAGNPDYIDDDSDGDGLADWIEGFDDDEDGDALNDLILRANNYESVNGNPFEYVTSDDGDNDGIPDFLENSVNGIPNFSDPTTTFYEDNDGDGIINLYDNNDPNRTGAPSTTPDTDGDGEYDFRDTDDQVSLPVELVSFDARKFGKEVILSWKTLTEINNDYFIIERSTDGKNFEQIIKQKGNGNSTVEHSYTDIDQKPKNGNNYYRLTQFDFNGKSEVFDKMIRMVSFYQQSENVKIYPNPTNGDKLYLEINQLAVGKLLVEILNPFGQTMNKRELSIDELRDNFKLEVLNGISLSGGTYYVKVTNESSQEFLPFVISD